MILPAVVKYVFRSVSDPENVRAVGVPPTVIPVPGLPAMTPSAIVRVTVHGATESTSPKGVPENCRLPGTSSVTVKLAGAKAVGASFTLFTVIVKVFSVNNPPRSVDRTQIK